MNTNIKEPENFKTLFSQDSNPEYETQAEQQAKMSNNAKFQTLPYYWYIRKPIAGSYAGIEEIETIRRKYIGPFTAKTDLPCISILPVRCGGWVPSQYFFFDIDTTVGVDTIIENRDLLFNKARFIRTIQKSSSKNLHITAVGPHKYDIENAWKTDYCIYFSALLEIIKKLFNIDYYNMTKTKILSDGTTQQIPVVDMHNAGKDQLFFVSYNTVYYSPYQDEYSEQKFSDTDIDKLHELYPKLFNVIASEEQDTNIRKDLSNALMKDVELLYPDNFQKIKIDSKYIIKTGKYVYSGNDIRWRISNIANKYFDKQIDAKQWCDKHFYFENGKSIWQKLSSKDIPISGPVLNELYKIGVAFQKQKIVDTGKFNIVLKESEYLSDYKEDILNFVKDNPKCEIVSPTGSGKTTLIGECLIEHFGNAVIVNPMNSTNSLYNEYNVKCVSSHRIVDEFGRVESKAEREERNIKYIFSGGNLVMIVNQLINYQDMLEGRPLIIDEAHTLFTDLIFRYDVMNKMKELIKRWNGPVILMTATPTIENQYIDAKILNIAKIRSNVHVDLDYLSYGLSNVINEEFKILSDPDIVDNYDHIIIFDNKNSKPLRMFIETKYGLDKLCILRKSEQNSDNYNNVISNQCIDKKFTICTSVAFQGLNFKNTDKLYAITVFDELETFKQTIVQIGGRFRCGQTYMKIFAQIREHKKDNKYEISDLFNKLCLKNGLQDCVSKNILTEHPEAILNIQEYLKDECTMLKLIDYIIENLDSKMEFHYIDYTSPKRYKPEEIKEYNAIFIRDLKSGSWSDEKYKIGYLKDLQCEMWNIIMQIKDKDLKMNISSNTFGRICENRPYNMEIINCLNIVGDDYIEYNTTNYENMLNRYNRLNDWMKSDDAVKIKKSKHPVDRGIWMEFNNLRKKIYRQMYFIKFMEDNYKVNNIVVENNVEDNIVNANNWNDLFDTNFKVNSNGENNILFNKLCIEFYEKCLGNSRKRQMKALALGRTSEHQKDAGKIGGKIGSPKKKVKYLPTGKIYDSAGEMCKDLGHSITWASKHKDLWVVIK